MLTILYAILITTASSFSFAAYRVWQYKVELEVKNDFNKFQWQNRELLLQRQGFKMPPNLADDNNCSAEAFKRETVRRGIR